MTSRFEMNFNNEEFHQGGTGGNWTGSGNSLALAMPEAPCLSLHVAAHHNDMKVEDCS